MIIIRSGDKSAMDLQNQILVDWPIGGKFRNPTVGLDRCVCLPLRPSQKLFRGLPHGGFEPRSVNSAPSIRDVPATSRFNSIC
jgi:hypothetical protein